MAQEKRNPLPVGRYWLNVVGAPHIADFSAWVATNNASVVIENIEMGGHAYPTLDAVLTAIDAAIPEPTEPGTPIDPDAIPTGSLGADSPPLLFVIFQVKNPVNFDATEFGPPDIATPDVHTQSDTAYNTDPTKEAADKVDTVIRVVEGLAFVLTLKTLLDVLKNLRKPAP